MTAEVAILNQNGAALAADSAVTITAGNDIKIFNSVHKLFRLSKRHPVGVMIYGAASLLNVPWEVIIKLYRKQLDNRKFDNLFEYGYDFLKYLHTSSYNFFPEENQEKYIYFTSCGICRDIIQKVNEEVQKILANKPISEKELKRIVSNEVDNSLKIIKSYSDISGELSPSFIRKNFIEVIERAIDDTFQKLPIYKKDRVKVIQLICLYFTKNLFSPMHSGIIFSGYGELDFYPKLISFKIESVLKDRLRYSDDRKTEITFEKRSEIHAFAQGEMVHTFIEGIDPFQSHTILAYLKDIFQKFPKIIIEVLEDKLKIGENDKKEIQDLVNEGSRLMHEEFIKEFNKYRKIKHVGPILSMVAMLPKDELATMAETLVNLTSFKRRVSLDTETVGGPIDVAIITKGDGFIWVKRKPKFDLQLNAHLIGESI